MTPMTHTTIPAEAISIADFVNDYEFRGDPDYRPTENERVLIEDAISGYVALQAESSQGEGWRDIASAPKDGTDILAIVDGVHPGTGRPFIPEVVYWDSNQWWNCMWSPEEDRCLYEPTHWMPLPAAPQTGEAK